MDTLVQQLSNWLETNIFAIVILIVALAVSCVIANFLRRRFREFFKGRLSVALLFLVVMVIGISLGIRFAEIEIGIFSEILHYPLTDLLFPGSETETEVSGMNRLTLVGFFCGFVVVFGMFILSKYVQSVLDRHVNIKEDTKPTVKKRLLHYAFIAVGVLISLNIIGVSLTNFAIALGGMSIGIGIGLQTVVSNLIARLIIFFEKPIKDGDLVELREQNLFGRIVRIDLCSTVIVSLDEKTIIIPNSQLTTDSIHNLSDMTFHIRLPDEDAILHIEAQTDDSRHRPMPSRMLAYSSFLSLEHEKPVYSAVLYFRPSAGQRDPGVYRYGNREQGGVEFWYNVIRVYELEGEAFLDPEALGLLPFTALMKPPADLTAEAWIEKCVQTTQQASVDKQTRGTLLFALSLFGSLVHSPELFQNPITEAIMQESPFYERVLQQGIAQGKREAVLRLLRRQFQEVPEPLSKRIAAIDSISDLDALLDRVMTAKSLDELQI